MFKQAFVGAVSIITLVGSLWCSDQGGIAPFRQIRLPVSASRGHWGPWNYVDGSARRKFATCLAPDQSILIFDSDTSGSWTFVRVRKWWTENPTNEALQVPAWGSTDAKHLFEVFVDVQVTPDGRYAVTFAGAEWMEKGDVARQPDTIITVIDLDRWQILKSSHTAPIASGEVTGLRVVKGQWVALDFEQGESPSAPLLYRHFDKLLTVPDLQSGPACAWLRAPRGGPTWPRLPREPESQNNAACHDVLQATSMGSLRDLETAIFRGQDVEPGPLVLRSKDLQIIEDAYFRHWGKYRDYLPYFENPPLESPSGHWYGLYSSKERGYYDLEAFDLTGKSVTRQTVRNLLCGDRALEHSRSACGCRVTDVSETDGDLLARCLTQRGNRDGGVRREWVAVLRTDDSTGVGYINLSKSETTTEAIAEGQGHTYVITVESGETVRVYAVASGPLEP